MRRLPIRLRLTAGFAAVMAVLFGGLAFGLYTSMSGALLDELDAGLRARAAVLSADLPRVLNAGNRPALIDRNETFTQIYDAGGNVVVFTPGYANPTLEPDIVRRVLGTLTFERSVSGVENVARILTVRVGDGASRKVVVVGASMSDRADALRQLVVFSAAGGPLALALASVAGWFFAGRALGPVERLRAEASAISAAGPERRLNLPVAEDEIRRLAETLNLMLSRLEEASQKERRFLDDASHELRTPLTALKAELDVALARPRDAAELARALASASEETNRLARMAEDLLVLSRARDGRLPLHREATSLRALLDSSAALFAARASTAGVTIAVDADDPPADVDPVRVRQAVDNLIDNALRFSPPGSTVSVTGRRDRTSCRIVVEDGGPGFPAALAGARPQPFHREPDSNGSVHDGAGLGLVIVLAVAESHGGALEIGNTPSGGGRVSITLATSIRVDDRNPVR